MNAGARLTAMRALNDYALFQLSLGYSADTRRTLKVHIPRLDTSDTTQLLVSLSKDFVSSGDNGARIRAARDDTYFFHFAIKLIWKSAGAKRHKRLAKQLLTRNPHTSASAASRTARAISVPVCNIDHRYISTGRVIIS